MQPRARLRFVAAGFALLALAGLWIGHAVEYLRVWGTEGLLTVLVGSVHAYMLPFGAVIAVAAGAAGLRLWRLWTRLGLRLDSARHSLRAALTGRVSTVPQLSPPLTPSLPAGLAIAWPVLSTVQVGLYLAQENLEALRAGLSAPGFGAITGVHALAPAVHATVALALLLVVAAAHRLLHRRASAVDRIEGILRRLCIGSRPQAAPGTPRAATSTPLQRLGWQLWRRPPPGLVLG